MDEHPIRIVVEDDFRRSRLTVFFRLLLAIPHLIWLILWTIAALVAAIVNWFVTLVAGRPADGLHSFLGAYVRYNTHLYAYLYLAANPWPGFTGTPGTYPVDLEIDPPQPQNRWKTLFRLVLALPALVLASALAGGAPGGGGGSGSSGDTGGDDQGVAYQFGAFLGGLGAVASVVAFLAWFACLARGVAPTGFRDLVVWTLRYSAQAYGYLLLLNDRYPNSDPQVPPATRPEKPLAVRLLVEDDLRRSRLTVFFRLLLTLPHFIWLALWGIAAFFAAIASWFVTLIAGRPLLGLHRFLSAYVRYQAQVYAFLSLAANPFPGFTGEPGYPVEVEIDGPRPQRRLLTAFRLLLAIPAWFVSYVLTAVLYIAAIFGWFVSLVLGRMPLGLRNACAFAVHYAAQFYAYLYLLTDRYPYSGPVRGTEPAAEPVEPAMPRPWPIAASEPG